MGTSEEAPVPKAALAVEERDEALATDVEVADEPFAGTTYLEESDSLPGELTYTKAGRDVFLSQERTALEQLAQKTTAVAQLQDDAKKAKAAVAQVARENAALQRRLQTSEAAGKCPRGYQVYLQLDG
jgi:hypothetical protein